MRFHPLLIVPLAAFALSGCKTPYKETDKLREDKRKDASGDPTFEAFVGRLRTAATKRDYGMLQSMMVSDFLYRWDNAPPGDNVYTYWSLNNIWPELERILRQPFAINRSDTDVMVSPPAFFADPNYQGYRAGIAQVNGSWRFVYFVPAPPPSAQTEFTPPTELPQ